LKLDSASPISFGALKLPSPCSGFVCPCQNSSFRPFVRFHFNSCAPPHAARSSNPQPFILPPRNWDRPHQDFLFMGHVRRLFGFVPPPCPHLFHKCRDTLFHRSPPSLFFIVHQPFFRSHPTVPPAIFLYKYLRPFVAAVPISTDPPGCRPRRLPFPIPCRFKSTFPVPLLTTFTPFFYVCCPHADLAV